jgi:3-oxoacyl-[acyl-carrier-protein] synthase II
MYCRVLLHIETKRQLVCPVRHLQGMHNAAASWIAIEHRLTGPNLTYATACSSSGVAIGEAWHRVVSGIVDLAVEGGSEAPLALGSMKALEAMHTLASSDVAAPSESCKPFSKNRTGIVLGEGAATCCSNRWRRHWHATRRSMVS